VQRLHKLWVKFHELMKEGTALLFRPVEAARERDQDDSENGHGEMQIDVLSEIAKEPVRKADILRGIKCATEAKECLDQIEWGLWNWRVEVFKLLCEVERRMGAEWLQTMALRFPALLGVEKKSVMVVPQSGRKLHDSRR